MRTPKFLLLVLLGLLATPLLAWPELSPEEIAANRRVIGKWKNDADHYAQLKADLKAFRTLPPERQQRMRLLDQELYQEDPATRTRLWNVMDSYVTWLEQLSPVDRQKIESTADTGRRLQLIRDMREKEWLARLPQAKQTALKAAPEAQRTTLIARWREEERDRRRRWDQALANPLEEKKPQRAGQPVRLNEFPVDVQTFVNFVLIPALTEDDRKQLDAVEGKPWPEFAQKLLTLAEKNPPVLPGSPNGPKQIRELPKPIRVILQQFQPQFTPVEREKLRTAQGKWPEYGIAVTEVIRKFGDMPREMGPCKPRDFGPLFQGFLENRLLDKLDNQEKKKLRDAEGKWPEYPQTLLELATKYKLPLPGMRLPGPREFWEKVRAGG